ncbi:MAG: Secretion system C-terminal sorting domain, partial [Bacteroidota bacterium]
EGNLVAHILDLSGRLIQETNLQVQEGENIFQLDLASLSKGNYIIVLTQNQRRETLKVIKQ